MSGLPRLVAFDLDGTLLDAAKRLTSRTVAAVHALADAGVLCVVASGRMYRHCMESIVAELGVTTPVIGYNGAMVIDPASGRPLSEKPIEPDLVVELMDLAGERHLNLYRDDQLYCRRPTEWSALYAQRTGAQAIFRDDLYTWYAGQPSTKALIIDQPDAATALLGPLHERFGARLTATISDPEYVEITAPGADKGWALTALCESLGVDLADTAAFGDSLNDLPMLEIAGLSYAMANAKPAVIAACDRLAPAHTEDGVAQVIEGWLAG